MLKGVRGIYVDTYKAVEDTELLINGDVVKLRKGETFTLPENENIILNSFSKLIVKMLTGGEYLSDFWWEIGIGSNDWDDYNLPKASKTDTQLTQPVFRKRIETVEILEDEMSIQLTVKFDSTEANYVLREFSIYYGGGVEFNTGTPINRKIHESIPKTIGVELTRKIIFKF